MLSSNSFDALIVGAGPAGLSVALGLCRQRRPAVLFDSGVYRNAITPHMHNVVTWDHKVPAEFRANALAELTQGRYNTVEYVRAQIDSVEKRPDGTFHLLDSSGKGYHGKKLVIASGVTDILPAIVGFKETWESMNIYHCLFCHGFEDSGSISAGVIAVDNMVPPMAAHFAKMCRPFAKNVTLYTHGSEPVAEACRLLIQDFPDIGIDTRKIVKLLPGTNGASPEIELENGDATETVSHGFFAYQPKVSPNIGFASKLDLKLSASGSEVQVSQPFLETSVRGCFATGDISTPFRAVAGAIAAGVACAGGVVSQL